MMILSNRDQGRKTRRSIIRIIPYLILILLLVGCSRQERTTPKQDESIDNNKINNTDRDIDNVIGGESSDLDLGEEASSNADISDSLEEKVEEEYNLIYPEGNILETRITPPIGYKRLDAQADSLLYFLRTFPMKEDGSKVLLYNGENKGNQSAHVSVFDLEIGTKDLQQCADSIIRIYAEYFWQKEEYDKIAFHLTNGFLMEYSKWREGNRLNVSGNKVSWVKKAAYDASYESFRKYLDSVYMYAGTLSLSEECSAITFEDMDVGDMFLQGGSPGHCVLVVDVAESETGERCYLLAQGFMPAQEFHVLKNPLREEDPWYYESELSYPVSTPQWTFEEGSLRRWIGLK